MNCNQSGAIARIGGAQKRASGVGSAKYSFTEKIDERTGIERLQAFAGDFIRSGLRTVGIICGRLCYLHDFSDEEDNEPV